MEESGTVEKTELANGRVSIRTATERHPRKRKRTMHSARTVSDRAMPIYLILNIYLTTVFFAREKFSVFGRRHGEIAECRVPNADWNAGAGFRH